MFTTGAKPDKSMLEKLGKLTTKQLLIYSYGLSIMAINKDIIEKKQLEQMIEQTKKHSKKLFKGK